MVRSEAIRPVSELLDAQAHERPGKPALRDEAGSTTYGELAEVSARLAGHLRALGIEPGDSVGLFMSNSTRWVEATLGTVRAGAVSVPVPAQATAQDAAYMLADSGARIAFVDAAHRDILVEARRIEPSLEGLVIVNSGAPARGPAADAEHDFERLARTVPDDARDADDDLDRPGWILYTSGTTGRPKGVVLTQRSMLWVVAAGWLPFLEWGADDVVLCPLPLTHSYPLDATLATLAVGATEHVAARFSPAAVWRILEEHDVTVLLGVPTVFTYLMHERDEAGGGYARRSLRMCVSAGASLPPDVCERAAGMLGAPILDAYGATEASTAITMTSPKGRTPRGSCGVSLPGMAVRVVDPTTGADRAPGEEGEVIARGPGIMLGYHNSPAETAATLREGWYHTGDLGRFDRHGNLSITGRLKDIIIRGGENIAPAEIESVVIEHAAIADCAVVGTEHPSLGEVPVLAVVPAGAADGVELVELIQGYCRERLPNFKQPERIVVVDAVPRTGSGKVMRHRLREAIEVRTV